MTCERAFEDSAIRRWGGILVRAGDKPFERSETADSIAARTG